MAITGGQIFDDADMSANATSEEVVMVERLSIGIRLQSPSAARAGDITIEGKIGGGDWDAIAFFDDTGTIISSIPVVTATAFSATIQLSGLNYDRMRVVFTDSAAGAGVLNGWVDRGWKG
jgi:hypothetical protein